MIYLVNEGDLSTDDENIYELDKKIKKVERSQFLFTPNESAYIPEQDKLSKCIDESNFVIKIFCQKLDVVEYYEMGAYKVLGELMDRFCHDFKLIYHRTVFKFGGIILEPDDIPKLAFRLDMVNVIEAEVIDSPRKQSEDIFHKLNRIAQVLDLNRSGTSFPFHSDTLCEILSYLPLSTLLQVTMVNVYWHIVSQRYSMIIQLECGICGWMADQPYPMWMHGIVSNYTWKLAIMDSNEKIITRSQWKNSFTKYILKDHYPLSKTVGVFPLGSYKRRRYQLRSPENSYFAEMNEFVSTLPTTYTIEKEQEYPSPNSKGFITPAYSASILNSTLHLFNEYFSPNMYNILPLIAYKQHCSGLDFRNCHTWVIFPQMDAADISVAQRDKKVKIAGAVYWRFHQPQLLGIEGSKETREVHGAVKGVLEVLFLAVWTKYRKEKFGRMLVDKLKQVALENKCPILYVEIGIETPLAFNFWRKNGFKEIDGKEDPPPVPSFNMAQMAFIENRCMRFNDTRQFVTVLV